MEGGGKSVVSPAIEQRHGTARLFQVLQAQRQFNKPKGQSEDGLGNRFLYLAGDVGD